MTGLIALGLSLKSAVTSFKSYDRIVSVKGLAEMEVPANKVIWPNVTSILTVTSEKVDKVREIITGQSDLLQKGVAISAGDFEHSTEYIYTKLNDIKPVMIEEATKNARASAEKFAKDSDSKLGKIKSAYQGQFSISDRDANTPYIKTVRVVSTIDYLLRD